VLSRQAGFATFSSLASNLLTGADGNGDRDVFLENIGTGQIVRSSVDTAGNEVNGSGVESTASDVTDDGKAVVFESTQTALVAGDTNGDRDVFRRYAPVLKKFRRGDSNNDGTVNSSDPTHILNHLFTGGPEPPCLDAADCNDDGAVNVTDPVFLLNHLFEGGDPPPPPGINTCGTDPTPDFVTCNTSICPQ
jgi:hypothetical protein